MMNGIQAIETFYRGIMFRSRLEARWAKLFSELGIDWTYETEGYNVPLKDGTHVRYLPDFVLRGGSVRRPDPLYVEVKGNMKAEDAIKIRAFSEIAVRRIFAFAALLIIFAVYHRISKAICRIRTSRIRFDSPTIIIEIIS